MLGEAPAGGAEVGHSEEARATVYQKHSTMQTRKWKYMV